MSYHKYSQKYYSNRQSLFPLRTTEYEDNIYENYQLYLRQLVCSLQMGHGKYICVNEVEDITNQYRFYSDWQRRALYKELDNIFRPILLGWKTAWKELEIHVHKNSKETFSPDIMSSHVNKLEKLYTKFMADKMETNKEFFRSSPKYLNDCKLFFTRA